MKYLTGALGVLALLLFGLLLALPISGEAQLAFALPALAVMLVIDRLNLGGAARPIFLTLGFALIARYIVWRATSTLPPVSDTLNFAASAVVFAAELFCFVTFTLGLFTVMRPIRREAAPRLTAAAAPSDVASAPILSICASLPMATRFPETRAVTPKPVCEAKFSQGSIAIFRSCASSTTALARGCSERLSTAAA